MRTRLRGKISLLFMTFGLLLAIPAIALADIIQPDGDIIAGNNQTTVDLGNVVVGGEVSKQASFVLECSGTKHVDNGQTVKLTYSSTNSSISKVGGGTFSGGSSSATTATIGPVGTSWPDDTTGGGGTSNCGSPEPTPLPDNGNSTVTITAPSDPGDYEYVVKWENTLSPSGTNDNSSISASFTNIKYKLKAIDDCPTGDNSGSLTDGSCQDPNAGGGGGGGGGTPPANNPPTVSSTAADANGDEGDTLTTHGAFSDADGDALTIIKQSGAGTVTQGANGAWSWSLPTNDNDSGMVVVEASDGKGGTATDTFTWSAANVEPTVQLSGPLTVNENKNGSEPYSISISDPGTADTHQLTDASCGAKGTMQGTPTLSGFSCRFDDGPATSNVSASVQDDDGGIGSNSVSVTVNNVPPTIESISASAQNALTGKNVTFTGKATDPSSADTATGFFWQWSKDGGDYDPLTLPNTFAAGGNPFTTTFSTCGAHYVSAKATDKDRDTSDPVSSSSVNLYNASFLPPVDVSPYVNTVQKGRVIPVKISVSCNGNITGLTPSIQLLNGDKTDGSETTADEIETYSVSSADTTGVMRAVDGGYIYNLRVPDVANAYYTVRVNPFGGSNASSNMYALLKTRK